MSRSVHAGRLAIAAGVYRIAWGIWFGGGLALGAIAAPAVFARAREWAATAGLDSTEVARHLAGYAVGEAFGRFNWVGLACGVVMLLAVAHEFYHDRGARLTRGLQLLLTVLPFALGLYLTLALFPRMLALRAAGAWGEFDRLHRDYVGWSQLQLLMLLGAGVFACFRRVSPRS